MLIHEMSGKLVKLAVKTLFLLMRMSLSMAFMAKSFPVPFNSTK